MGSVSASWCFGSGDRNNGSATRVLGGGVVIWMHSVRVALCKCYLNVVIACMWCAAAAEVSLEQDPVNVGGMYSDGTGTHSDGTSTSFGSRESSAHKVADVVAVVAGDLDAFDE